MIYLIGFVIIIFLILIFIIYKKNIQKNKDKNDIYPLW